MAILFSTTLTPLADTFAFPGFNVDIPWTIYALAGNDSGTILGGWKTICYMGDGDDFVRVNGGTYVQVFGENGNDRVDMYAASVLFDGGSGDDILNVYGGTHVTAYGGIGSDRINFYVDMAADVRGDDGDDLFYGFNHALAGTLSGGAGNDQFIDFRTLTGGSLVLEGGIGNDTYQLSSTGVTVHENAGEGTDRIKATVSYTLGANIENLSLLGSANLSGTGNSLANAINGNAGANLLTGLGGNDTIVGGAGADRLIGGDGNDWLDGGAGLDQYTGGLGSDRFVFRDGQFGGATTASADVIHDFSHAQIDRIGLDAVDANRIVAGNQAFAFIGVGQFSGVAGQLRYEQLAGNTFVQGDTNGDRIADFMIQLDGLHALGGGDFYL